MQSTGRGKYLTIIKNFMVLLVIRYAPMRRGGGENLDGGGVNLDGCTVDLGGGGVDCAGYMP